MRPKESGEEPSSRVVDILTSKEDRDIQKLMELLKQLLDKSAVDDSLSLQKVITRL